MAHITTGVEYSLHGLLYLVDPPEEARPAIARDLADLQGVPVEYIAKLFTQLQKAGLVAASEGARDVCSIHAIMLQAEAQMRKALASHTLTDVAASVAAKASPSFSRKIAKWLADRASGPRRSHNIHSLE